MNDLKEKLAQVLRQFQRHAVLAPHLQAWLTGLEETNSASDPAQLKALDDVAARCIEAFEGEFPLGGIVPTLDTLRAIRAQQLSE